MCSGALSGQGGEGDDSGSGSDSDSDSDGSNSDSDYEESREGKKMASLVDQYNRHGDPKLKTTSARQLNALITKCQDIKTLELWKPACPEDFKDLINHRIAQLSG